MFRLNSFALPALVVAMGASPAIPTIPTLLPAGPPTSGIVASQDGSIYFIDSYHNTVWRVQPGRGREAFVTGRNGRSLQIDEQGNIYGTHTDARGRLILWRADPTGAVTEMARPEVPEQFGHAFVIDDGELVGFTGAGKRTAVRLWRAGDHERHLAAAGAELAGHGAPAENALFQPIGGMALTPGGELLVTSGASIRRIGANGRVTTVAQGEKLLRPRHSLLARLLGDMTGHLTGIAVAGNGDIYVANGARHSVIRIDGRGRVHEVLKSDGGWTPTGVVATKDCVYVLEYGNGVRVLRIAPGGPTTVVALVRVDRTLASTIGSRLISS